MRIPRSELQQQVARPEPLRTVWPAAAAIDLDLAALEIGRGGDGEHCAVSTDHSSNLVMRRNKLAGLVLPGWNTLAPPRRPGRSVLHSSRGTDRVSPA